jgi:hypothetical protein
MPNFRPSLSEIQSRLKLYLDNSAPGQTFQLKSGYDGFLGSRLGATREFVEIYHMNGAGPVKVAEVGRLLRSPSKLVKPGEVYAEQVSIRGEDKKHHPVYSPDKDLPCQERVLGEGNLAKVVRGEH